VDFLTVKYNASVLEMFNLAYGGATVNSTLVAPYEPTVISLQQQVQDEFIPAYTGASPAAPSAPAWTGANSLFAFWIGINDVGNSYYYGTGTTGPLNAKIFAVYSGLVDTLYSLGARNFVFINVPPVDRSPLMLAQGTDATTLEKADLAAFNGLIGDMAKNLTTAHAGAVNVWVYDSNASFSAVLDNPAVYTQTAGYKNTTAYCDAYEK
jgi:phospholipase/lecithinase/hemolysin